MILAAAVVLVLGAVATVLLRDRLQRGLVTQRIHKTLLVTLKTGQTFQGLLAEVASDAIVLRNALLPDGRGVANAVDGELILLRADIAYMQRP